MLPKDCGTASTRARDTSVARIEVCDRHGKNRNEPNDQCVVVPSMPARARALMAFSVRWRTNALKTVSKPRRARPRPRADGVFSALAHQCIENRIKAAPRAAARAR